MRRPLLAACLLALAPLAACGSEDPAGTRPPAQAPAEVRGVDAAAVEKAETDYAAYVRTEADALLARTRQFAAAYVAGQDAKARMLYPLARTHWERIEPVAEAFGDLDPRLDLREADLEAGGTWTGWHRAEKDLWLPKGAEASADRKAVAEGLVANTVALHEQVQQEGYDALDMANGAKGLLDEVASGKITGEEDIWSHTDLYDFQANVDGSRKAFEVLAPLLQVKDEELVAEVTGRFDALQEVLDGHRTKDGFADYRKVTEPQRKQLSDAVNALAEPIATMAGVLAR